MGFNSIFLASVKQALPFSRVRFKGLGRAGCSSHPQTQPEEPQAGTAPCPLQSPENVPRARPPPGLSAQLLKSFIPAFFVLQYPCHHPVPPPDLAQHKPQPSWHFGVALCFSLQDTPTQSSPGWSDRSGRLGRAPGTQTSPSLPLPGWQRSPSSISAH